MKKKSKEINLEKVFKDFYAAADRVNEKLWEVETTISSISSLLLNKNKSDETKSFKEPSVFMQYCELTKTELLYHQKAIAKALKTKG